MIVLVKYVSGSFQPLTIAAAKNDWLTAVCNLIHTLRCIVPLTVKWMVVTINTVISELARLGSWLWWLIFISFWKKPLLHYAKPGCIYQFMCKKLQICHFDLWLKHVNAVIHITVCEDQPVAHSFIFAWAENEARDCTGQRGIWVILLDQWCHNTFF